MPKSKQKKKEQAADEVIEWLDRFFADKQSDDLPHELDIDLDAFHAHRDNWTLWRALGHYSPSGSWVTPVSFLEAQQLPKEALDVYLMLDDLLGRMQRQFNKKKAQDDNDA